MINNTINDGQLSLSEYILAILLFICLKRFNLFLTSQFS